MQLVEKDLVYETETTTRTEEALKKLGGLIGLHTERPDKSKGTGPDVTWHGAGDPPVWGFELKTKKNKGSEYSKRDISQCHDHEKWLTTTYDNDCRLTIVGPMLTVSEKANPSDTLRITEIDCFQELLKRAKKMLDAVESGGNADLEGAFQSWLDHYGLNWPFCVDALDNRLAVDRRGE